ncbi:hypothetical protein EVAR_90075_1 [Eumeta japonica]|uniref:Uncharacterized protein n=1 Tax=Eumeta variegata TaxID=151549 RepID=A0A4C1X225_EUMVA|nr:hypothetical protein EVAR_90075_1 [Eumeta japonica]
MTITYRFLVSAPPVASVTGDGARSRRLRESEAAGLRVVCTLRVERAYVLNFQWSLPFSTLTAGFALDSNGSAGASRGKPLWGTN